MCRIVRVAVTGALNILNSLSKYYSHMLKGVTYGNK